MGDAGMPPKLTSPIQPFRGWRTTDSFGSGNFGASRDGNSRRHMGADAIVVPGDVVLSPITGRIDKVGLCYPGDTLRYVRIVGRGEHDGVMVRLLYVEPGVSEGASVNAGSLVGTAQDIGRRDVGITPHIHVEVWRADDPARFIE